MTVNDMKRALEALGQRLETQGIQADIVIAGGAWMALVLGSRQVTKDIDAYIAPPSEPVHRAAKWVAENLGLPSDWLNDGIKGFFYGTVPHELFLSYGGLRLYAVAPDYMLALKVFAARDVDCPDVQALVRHLQIGSLSRVLEIVEQYIPSELLTAKHQYFAESCLEGS